MIDNYRLMLIDVRHTHAQRGRERESELDMKTKREIKFVSGRQMYRIADEEQECPNDWGWPDRFEACFPCGIVTATINGHTVVCTLRAEGCCDGYCGTITIDGGTPIECGGGTIIETLSGQRLNEPMFAVMDSGEEYDERDYHLVAIRLGLADADEYEDGDKYYRDEAREIGMEVVGQMVADAWRTRGKRRLTPVAVQLRIEEIRTEYRESRERDEREERINRISKC